MEEKSDQILKAAHTIAACISAVLCTGLSDDDPQVPYWCTFDVIRGGWVDATTRTSLERFFAIVTLCRGQVMPATGGHLATTLENGFNALPAAIDGILDYLENQGADQETLDVWNVIADHVTDPELALGLAQELGMAKPG